MSTLTKTQKVTGVAAAVSAALAGYTTTQAQLEEIVVTATRRQKVFKTLLVLFKPLQKAILKKHKWLAWKITQNSYQL